MNQKQQQDGVQHRFSVADDRTSRRYSVAVSATAVPSRHKMSAAAKAKPKPTPATPAAASGPRTQRAATLASGGGRGRPSRPTANQSNNNNNNYNNNNNNNSKMESESGLGDSSSVPNTSPALTTSATSDASNNVNNLVASKNTATSAHAGTSSQIRPRRLTNKATLRRRLPGWKAYRARKNTELLQAVKVGDMARAHRLVCEGADVEMVDPDNMNRSLTHTALQFLSDDHAAAAAAARDLLELGADITAKDTIGNTALHIACSTGNLAATDVLLQQGLRCTTQNVQGDSALLFAVESGGLRLVQRLLKCDDAVELFASQAPKRPSVKAQQRGAGDDADGGDGGERNLSDYRRDALYRAALQDNNVAVVAEIADTHMRHARLDFDAIEKVALLLACCLFCGGVGVALLLDSGSVGNVPLSISLTSASSFL